VSDRRAVALLTLVAAVACARTPGGALEVASGPDEDDLALASRAVGEYRHRVRPSSDAAAAERLARVSGLLLDAAKAGPGGPRAKALTWDIVLVSSPDTTVATFPNGTIFVDAGLLRILSTDDALAGALGPAIVRPLLHAGGGGRGRHGGGGDPVFGFGSTTSRLDRATRETEEADYEGLALAVDAGYDPEAAVALFTEDASYRSSPFREPPNLGHEGVRAYWTRATTSQEDVEVEMGEPLVDGNVVAVEWWTRMRSEGEEITLVGCLLLRFAPDGRCADLREYWNLEGARIPPHDGWGSWRRE
jgi:hypothetical protein